MIICVSEVYSLDASNILQTVTSNAVSKHVPLDGRKDCPPVENPAIGKDDMLR